MPFGGLIILVVGWIGVPLGGANVTWLANPFLAVAWITLVVAWATSLSPRALVVCFAALAFSFASSALAVIFSASFPSFAQVTIGTSGRSNAISHLHIGYWLWLSSMIVMLVGNSIQLIVLGVQALQREMKETHVQSPERADIR